MRDQEEQGCFLAVVAVVGRATVVRVVVRIVVTDKRLRRFTLTDLQSVILRVCWVGATMAAIAKCTLNSHFVR